jgi:hypothetical protein
MNNHNAIHTVVITVARAVLEAHGLPQQDMEDSLADVAVRMIDVRARLRRMRTRFIRRLAAVDGFTTAVLDEVEDAMGHAEIEEER